MADGDRLFDISDSSDWLNTPLASFAQVESGLRCQVCKDFYKTPMITTCGHTFCSLCIRHCYSSDQKCPACRAAGQETQLRKNAALEELVEAFQNARVSALHFARQTPSNIRSASPKRKLDAVVEDETQADRPSKRTRSSSRRTTEHAKTIESAGQSRDTISLLDDEDGEYQPGILSTQSPSKFKSADDHRESDMVECPVCLHKVKGATINSHLDNDCPPKPKTSTLRLDVSKTPKSSRQSIPPSSTLKRLPYLSYNGMKEHILKKKLNELTIPSFGTKIDMQRRHTEWVAIWNSNCDAKHPKSARELRIDLDTWERTQGALAPKSNIGVGSTIKDDNFDGSGWAASHHNEFEDLIAKARQKRLPPKPTSPSSEPSTPTPSAAVVPLLDNARNHVAGGSNSNILQENVPPTRNSSSMMVKSSSNSDTEPELPKERHTELPSIPSIEQTGIEPPFPSSQISRLKTADEPSPSQFTVSPSSKRFFEDVDDGSLGITPFPLRRL